MPHLHEQFDADRFDGREPAMEFPMKTNPFEIPCSVCGRALYVDEETSRDFRRAMEFEFDNKFTCFKCEQEYDQLSHP
jgi:hypothetical protein